jgi:hypothetical protein
VKHFPPKLGGKLPNGCFPLFFTHFHFFNLHMFSHCVCINFIYVFLIQKIESLFFKMIDTLSIANPTSPPFQKKIENCCVMHLIISPMGNEHYNFLFKIKDSKIKLSS